LLLAKFCQASGNSTVPVMSFRHNAEHMQATEQTARHNHVR